MADNVLLSNSTDENAGLVIAPKRFGAVVTAGIGDVLNVKVIKAGDSVAVVFNADDEDDGVLPRIFGVIVTVGVPNPPNDGVCAVTKIEGDVVVAPRIFVVIAGTCPNILDTGTEVITGLFSDPKT